MEPLNRMSIGHEAKYLSKMHSEERILVVKAIAGKDPKNTGGLIDKRLFDGEPNLRAVRGPHNNLWKLQYDKGVLPNPLKQSFTNFSQLLSHVGGYFNRRNLEITEVIDDHTRSFG